MFEKRRQRIDDGTFSHQLNCKLSLLILCLVAIPAVTSDISPDFYEPASPLARSATSEELEDFELHRVRRGLPFSLALPFTSSFQRRRSHSSGRFYDGALRDYPEAKSSPPESLGEEAVSSEKLRPDRNKMVRIRSSGDEVAPRGQQRRRMMRIGEERNASEQRRVRAKWRKKPAKTTAERGLYDSYKKYGIDKFEKGTAEWQMAMLRYLLDMKQKGHRVREVESVKPLAVVHKELVSKPFLQKMPIPLDRYQESSSVDNGPGPSNGADVDPIICKMEPFNICFRVDREGKMHPIGDTRPVRLLRVY